MIRCVDLFCGIGGLTHGLARGGISVVAGVDIDPHCRFPYEANNHATFIDRDVAALNGSDLGFLWGKGNYTMLAGCAPCQPFSTYSRKGRAKRGDRNWDLVSHFSRLIKEASPDLVTMENVPQLLDHVVFDKFLSSVKQYHVWYDVVECARYGIPQTRKRLVLMASKVAPVSLPETVVEEGFATVKDAIGHLPRLSAGESDPDDVLHRACRLSPVNLKRIKASRPGGTWRDWPRPLIARCHRRKTGDTYPSVYGRMEWNVPAPTITTQCFGYGNGRFGHPEQDRAITLREAAILQTFPGTYRFLKPDEKVRFSILGRLIGNAVPVRLGEVVARALLAHLKSPGDSQIVSSSMLSIGHSPHRVVH